MLHQKRIGKKKGLTDPVEIIPFPGQSLRPATNTPKIKESVEQKTPIIPFKKEVKTLSSPTGQLNTTTISIKQMQSKQADEETTSPETNGNLPNNPFSLDELKMYWRQFAFKIKKDGLEGADSMHLAMIKRDPKMPTSTHIHQEFDNQIQIDLMKSNFESLLLEFLRNSLKNWSITVDFSLTETQEENLKHLTGRDRFEALAKKNTNLITLQKTFNLDIEY